MRISISLSALFLGAVLAADEYDPSQVRGVTDPVLIAQIEGYMPPICNRIYGDDAHWSEWSTCSALCGQGEQVRYLNGDGQKDAVSNGCFIKQQKQPCTGLQCPQDCLYTDWTPWTECDKTSGVQTRSRTIHTPALNGGKECLALWGETAAKQNCPVDCEGTWSDWSECSGVTATSTRTFTVTQRALNGGKACPVATDSKDCNPTCAAIPWPAFGACNPQTGTRTRTRSAPLDANYVNVTVALRDNKCPTVDTQPCDVDCVLSDWDRTGTCDPTTGTRTIKRTIVQNSLNCGKKCNSLEADTLLVSSENCRVDCRVSDWSSWECDQSNGVSTRTRSILQNPFNGGAECGSLQETRDCRDDECKSSKSCESCETNDWSAPSECSASTCLASRTRTMKYPERDAIKPCSLFDTVPCTLDAVMGEWSDWGPCDATAQRYRTREIISPACNGGKPAGETTDRESCQEICHEEFNPWNSWGECDKKTGKQTRSRAIVAPPAPSLQPCLTSETRDCAVNCEMDNWKEWGKCDEYTGIQSRNRNVLYPMQNGGNQCGPTQESQTCAVVCLASEWTPWTEADDECKCHRTRKQIAPAINGGECLLADTDVTCPQNCQVSEWSVPGECHKSGPHAGFRQKTRTITKKHCNGGAPCPADGLEMWEPCDIDCVMSDWSDFTECDLRTQTQTSTRTVLQESYGNGCPCGATEKAQACGACGDILSEFKYTECDIVSGTRTGTAEYLYAPKNGQVCTTTVSEDCDVDCKLTDWNAGSCHTQGPLAGRQSFTRDIRVSPKNNGKQCEDLQKIEECVVDCKAADTWTAWTECNADGFQFRKRELLWPAQNGGSNDDCLVQERKACPVDCVINPNTFEIITPSLNGGKTCKDVAEANGYPGSYSDVSSTINFMAMVASNKNYAMAALATGGMGIMFIVGFFTTRQRNGYNSITGQVAL